MTTNSSGYTNLRQLQIEGRLDGQTVQVLSGRSRPTFGISVVVKAGEEICSAPLDKIELAEAARDRVKGALTVSIPAIRSTEIGYRRFL